MDNEPARHQGRTTLELLPLSRELLVEGGDGEWDGSTSFVDAIDFS